MFRLGEDQEVSRDDFLDSMFRSELMTKCRFFIPPEAAYGSIGEMSANQRPVLKTLTNEWPSF